ncbi:peptidoglycan DD-metalloendopeptidase family protein [Candidatus Peregrinibacteria bacterium]|nr:peptidoglycan DD-metalloendopeptidase family protein [Candidatus Peregrinibacteria bacterium]
MRKLVFFIIFCLFLPSVNALTVLHKDQIKQGEILKVLIPDRDYKNISGSFNGKELKFFKINQEIGFDEPISRAEFLHVLMAEDINISQFSEEVFPDVKKDHQYFNSIMAAYESEIIHGYEDGFFKPYETITRGQAAKILVNFKNLKESVSLDFDDLPVTHVFFEHFSKAIAAGYFLGYPDGLLRPDRKINFNEAKTVIKRAVPEIKWNLPTNRNYHIAYTAAHRINDKGLKPLEVNTDIDNYSTEVDVLPKNYKIVRFSLSQEKNKLFGDEYQEKTWNDIYSAIADTSDKKLWEENFIIPASGVTTLGFGDKLYINGLYSGSHFGIDYANEKGTSIYASNNGIVKLSKDTAAYGKTIIIDHGLNVFTMYLHLNAINVSVGESVRKGEKIGEMGSTGISTGDHLHFTFFVGDVIVDNNEWYENSL